MWSGRLDFSLRGRRSICNTVCPCKGLGLCRLSGNVPLKELRQHLMELRGPGKVEKELLGGTCLGSVTNCHSRRSILVFTRRDAKRLTVKVGLDPLLLEGSGHGDTALHWHWCAPGSLLGDADGHHCRTFWSSLLPQRARPHVVPGLLAVAALTIAFTCLSHVSFSVKALGLGPIFECLTTPHTFQKWAAVVVKCILALLSEPAIPKTTRTLP